MISLILPVFNVERYLAQCVDSILKQTYQQFEVILIDDGSTDSSGSLCDDLAKRDKRIRVVHQSNKGVSAARNFGIELAEGEWVSFIDPDDYVGPDYLEKFEIERNDADFITQGLSFVDNRTGEVFKEIKFPDVKMTAESTKEIVEKTDYLSFGGSMCRAIRKSLIEQNGIQFNESIAYHEDHIFIFKLLKVSSDIRLVDSTSYYYRSFHSQNTLSNKHHPWDSLNLSSNLMIDCLNEMRSRFLKKNSQYEKKIYTIAYLPKISAVYELQRLDLNYNIRRCYYHEVVNTVDLLSYFYPVAAKYILVKWIMYFAPYAIIDLFMKNVVKYQDRKR